MNISSTAEDYRASGRHDSRRRGHRARHGGGRAARLPRNDTHIVATETGWVDLKGKSLRERAEALIGIARRKFRDELARALV